MNKPKVSVAIITYNAEKYIREVLESVVTQECNFDFDIVVGDDASSDGTLSILKEYALKYVGIVKVIEHAENVGANENYLDVLSAATGEYIAHLDGDDLMYPQKLQIQADYLDLNPDCTACFHNMRIFEDGTNRFIRLYNSPNRAKKASIDEVVKYGAGLNHSSKMFRRSTIEDIELTLPTEIVFDWLMHIIHARHGYLGYIDQVLGAYRISKTSVVYSNLKKIETVRQDLLLTLDLAKKMGADNSAVKYGRSRVNFERSMRALEQKRYKEFLFYINESTKESVFISKIHRVIFCLRYFRPVLRILHKIRAENINV